MAALLSFLHGCSPALKETLTNNLTNAGRMFAGEKDVTTVLRGVRTSPVPSGAAVHQAILMGASSLGMTAWADLDALAADGMLLRTRWLQWRTAQYGRRFLRNRLRQGSPIDDIEHEIMEELTRMEARLLQLQRDMLHRAAAGVNLCEDGQEDHGEHGREDLNPDDNPDGLDSKEKENGHEDQDGNNPQESGEDNVGDGPLKDLVELCDEVIAAGDEVDLPEAAPNLEEHDAVEEEEAPNLEVVDNAGQADPDLFADYTSSDGLQAGDTAMAAAAAATAGAEGAGAAADSPGLLSPSDEGHSLTGLNAYQDFLRAARKLTVVQDLPRSCHWAASRALWQERKGAHRQTLKAVNEILSYTGQPQLQVLQPLTVEAFLVDLKMKIASAPVARRNGCTRCRWRSVGCYASCWDRGSRKRKAPATDAEADAPADAEPAEDGAPATSS